MHNTCVGHDNIIIYVGHDHAGSYTTNNTSYVVSLQLFRLAWL